MNNHYITTRASFARPDTWLCGKVDDYDFQAKICDPTGDTLNDGRIINLHISGKGVEQEFLFLERGWGKYPKTTHKGMAEAMIRFLDSLPEQAIWENTFRDERRFLVTEDAVLECEDENH